MSTWQLPRLLTRSAMSAFAPSRMARTQPEPSLATGVPLSGKMEFLREEIIQQCHPMMVHLQRRFPHNETLANINNFYTEQQYSEQLHHHGALALKMGQLVAISVTAPQADPNKSLAEEHVTLAKVLSLLNLGFQVHHCMKDHSADDHLTTKLLILIGDYIITQQLMLLSSRESSATLLRLSAAVTQTLSEALFCLEDKGCLRPSGTVADWQSHHYGLNVHQFALGCQGALELASITSERHLQAAYNFGLNYGYTFVASQEETLGKSQLPFGTLQLLQKQFNLKAIKSVQQLPLNVMAKNSLLELLH